MSKLKPFKISMPPEDLARFRSAQADAKRLVNRMLSEPSTASHEFCLLSHLTNFVFYLSL